MTQHKAITSSFKLVHLYEKLIYYQIKVNLIHSKTEIVTETKVQFLLEDNVR